ncbi:uncharacterized protein LOC141655133 [Silene latifolia]|uniref:uncharacterized protein LOC141655133 n=1 Tax=Silene latifolia TaxID=37657 RepID=UPI003D78660B
MKFLVEKLSSIDRLSIITFSSDADRLCPLTRMHKDGQAKVEDLINNLRADGQTNITRGLQEALRVLVQRRQRNGRTSAIMLISDGELSSRCDHPSTVDVSGVPVFTFGLGKDHDIQVLQDIASRSDNGTYSIADVEGSDSASLTIAISSCDRTITQLGSDIQDVRVGNYEQTRDNESVTISFGNLYNREKRKTTLFLSLLAVEEQTAIDILKVTLSYRPSGGRTLLIKHSPITVTLDRTSSPVTVDPVEVDNEIARGDTAAGMQMARKQADANDFEGAKKTLDNAEKSLDHLNHEADELIKALKYEVQEFLRLLKDPETYLREGHAFALSSELSHNRQRFAARGDATQLLALAIPLVVLFANQAIEFEKNVEVRQQNNSNNIKNIASNWTVDDVEDD